ncbi:MAG: hypothetical protein AUK37_04265 [Rhodobacterales bacterium CG2_30_65_12]|nr:MAG: hypothetical protein AUK37_04265 [Rhodobacterales bacterium CG2_30_65_12]
MQILDFTGCFVLDGRETEEIALRVIVSAGGGGITSGSGSFALPLALVGWSGEGPLSFRLISGEVLTIVVREIDPVEGVAWFLTEGAMPVAGAPDEARRA